MKDIHNHVLYGIDDGSDSIDRSIRILKHLETEGVTDIVVTPHYIIGSNYNSNNDQKKKLLSNLQKKTSIKLYLGNEVFIDNSIIDKIKDFEISTINNTSYLLIEFPLKDRLERYYDILFELRNVGVIPIIAHPERYHYIKLDELVKLIDLGCLLQGNITSLTGRYGKEAKENLELLLKKRMVHVVGTDNHSNTKLDLKECLNLLKHLVSDDIFKDLTEKNFDKIINNKPVKIYDIIDTSTFFRKEKIK